MNEMKKVLLGLLLCAVLMAAFPWRAEAQSARVSDEAEVSLLTCAPGNKIYSLFGHTAIRFRDRRNGTDLVFNYGMFSFGTPHFIWRFMKGETDYELGIDYFQDFYSQYMRRGSTVYEQVLNLTDSEKRKLYDLLMENFRPENRQYRYNFFYDNCTTRAKLKIEEAVDGQVTYDVDERGLSFRDIIHQYTREYPWSQLGIDLCLGSGADRKITKDETAFAPFFYKEMLSHARVVGDDGAIRALAQPAKEIVVPSHGVVSGEKGIPSPLLCSFLLFILTVAVSFAEWKTGKMFWGYDLFLFAGAGFAGMVIAFLVFFSYHPTVSPNYLLLVMHPLHLLLLPAVLWKEAKREKCLYHLLNMAVLVLFIVANPIIPQHFDGAVIFLALSLLERSRSYTFRYYKIGLKKR